MQTLSFVSCAEAAVADTLDDDTLEPSSRSRWQTGRLFDAAGATHPGRVRVRNEDAYAIFADLGLCAVADGLGGRAGGEIASAMAIHAVHQALAWPEPGADGTPEDAFTKAVAYANKTIHDSALADSRLKGMATTFVGLLVEDGRAVIAHVGDSRVYRIRGGNVERLTMDHSMRELYLQVFKGRADPKVAEKNASIVTRAVGARPQVRVDMRIEEIVAGDTFLLCSDGLWDLVSDDEIAFAVVSAASLEGAVARLMATAYNRGAHDNITAVLVRPRGLPGSRPACS